MKVLDLFSGIGGFSLGLERAGMATVAFCEIDEDCRKVLKKHWPDTLIFEDIKNLKYHLGNFDMKCLDEGELRGLCSSAPIDVLCGGFPCQDISIAGNKKGLKGTQSSLWFEYKRLIDEIKPKYVIIENVANLRNLGLTTILQDLWSLGYNAEWHIISAASVKLLHQRQRIWIIAHPSGERLNEHTGEKRYLQINEDGQSKEIHSEGAECEFEPLPFRPILSPRVFDRLRNAIPDARTALSGIRRVTNGIPQGMDEKRRKQRIKQLGNAIVPQIAQIIGEAIMEYENGNR